MTWAYGNSVDRWHGYCGYSSSENWQYYTINMSECGMESEANAFSIGSGGVNASASVTGQGSVSGSGSFSSAYNQSTYTSYCSGSWNVYKTHSAQTVYLSFTVTQNVWRGGTSEGSVKFDIPALSSSTISYNANGGSGAPASQTKWIGEMPYLSTVKPTRTGYSFVSWNTNADGTGTSYSPGQQWGSDISTTLYAKWHLDYIAPSISNVVVGRCTSDGTIDESGTYIKVTGNWSVDTSINSANVSTSVITQYKLSTDSTWTDGSTLTAGTASGTISSIIGSGAIDPDKTYNIKITVSDSGGSSSATGTITNRAYILDFASDGGVGIGGPAPSGIGNMTITNNLIVGGNLKDANSNLYMNWLSMPFSGIWMGVNVVTVNSYGNAIVMTDAQVNAKMGRSFDNAKDLFLIMNGDSGATGDILMTSSFYPTNKSLYVHTNGPSGSNRILWLLLKAK